LGIVPTIQNAKYLYPRTINGKKVMNELIPNLVMFFIYNSIPFAIWLGLGIVVLIGILLWVTPRIVVPMTVASKYVDKMSAGKMNIVRDLKKDNESLDNLPDLYKDFLLENRFKFYGTFQVDAQYFSVWEQSSFPQRYFCLWQNNNPDFTTLFSENVSLSSAGHDYGFMFPRPRNSFLQSKKTKDLDQLWRYHLDGEQFLMEEFGIQAHEITSKVEDVINQMQIDQGKYISKIPFFWLRAPYWYHIKRFKMLNVSIREQLMGKK
jgi:hypothetical protein